MPSTDFLVIGSGVAGLSYALKVATSCPGRQVTVVTKSDEGESNTKYAQGGIAIVTNTVDSFEQHLQDTLTAGDGLCDETVAKFVVNEGPRRLEELIKVGVPFDKDRQGKFDLGREGGHVMNRVVHHKDVTGLAIEKALLKAVRHQQNVQVLPHHFAIDLVTEHHLQGDGIPRDEGTTCYGAYVLDETTGKIKTYTSKITLLASGGAGQVYGHTTNPAIATGDGVAMAYRAKAKINSMEFVQFHPTALYQPGASPAFLISEAVRGFGAKLKTRGGEAFMHKYDRRGELASRDIVAKAIDSELKRSGEECVYLDCRHMDIKQFKVHFPTIYEKCYSLGINVEEDRIPVVPAAHYMCGGIQVDHRGRTTIKRLFACGECAYTGLHGANRLASNSLLEAVVFADRCYKMGIKEIGTIGDLPPVPRWDDQGTTTPKEKVLISHNKNELQAVMRDYVGIVRSNERLSRAYNRLALLYKETEVLYRQNTLSPQLCELRNLIAIGYLIVKQSLQRKENRGSFWNIDLAAC